MTETSTYTHQEMSARLAEVERERDEAAAMVGRLRDELRLARANMEDWASYVPEYFQQKHNLAGDLASIDSSLAETPPTSLAEIRAEAVEAAANAMPDSTRPVYTHPQPAQPIPKNLRLIFELGAQMGGGAKLNQEQCKSMLAATDQPAQQVPEGWSVRHIDDPGGDGYLVKGPCLNYIVWKDKEPWHYLFLDALLTPTNPMARDRKQKWKETGK